MISLENILYKEIERLMDAKPDTQEALELEVLTKLAQMYEDGMWND